MPTVYQLWLCGQASRSPTNHPRAYGRTCPAPSRPMILGVPPKSSDVFLTCLASWEYFLFLCFFLAVWEVFLAILGNPTYFFFASAFWDFRRGVYHEFKRLRQSARKVPSVFDRERGHSHCFANGEELWIRVFLCIGWDRTDRTPKLFS